MTTTAGPIFLVANDSVPNYLYHNNHNGTFTEMGMLTGVALSGEGMELGNMGVDWGDYDHSGRLSFFVTHFEEQPNTLYRNMGSASFDERQLSFRRRTAQLSLRRVGQRLSSIWTTTSWLDLLVANGHVYPQIDTLETGPRFFASRSCLHRNNRDGTFDEVSKQADSRIYL